MAAKYLLSCSCGREIALETRQAGKEVVCECGKTLPVPALRKLRELPLAEETEQTTGATWSFRHGVLSAGLLLAIGLAAGGAYLWFTEPQPPPDLDISALSDQITEGVEQFTPAQGYEYWANRLANLGQLGFEPVNDKRRQRVLNKIAEQRAMMASLLIASGVVALISLALFAALPRSASG